MMPFRSGCQGDGCEIEISEVRDRVAGDRRRCRHACLQGDQQRRAQHAHCDGISGSMLAAGLADISLINFVRMCHAS
jgi:hypothetical protein